MGTKRWFLMWWTGVEGWKFPVEEGFESLEEARQYKLDNKFDGVLLEELLSEEETNH
jgi:hypothetical protein